MLKKAGIVVAAAAVGLLAVSPLAFAGEAHARATGATITTVARTSKWARTFFRRTPQGLVNILGHQRQRSRVNALNCDEVDWASSPMTSRTSPRRSPVRLALFGFG